VGAAIPRRNRLQERGTYFVRGWTIGFIMSGKNDPLLLKRMMRKNHNLQIGDGAYEGPRGPKAGD